MVHPVIYIISDSVGETAELVTKAAISQFNGNEAQVIRYPFVEDESQLAEVIIAAKEASAMIVYTLIKPEMRKLFKRRIEEEGIDGIDIMGPLMDKLEVIYDQAPLYEPGLVRKLDAEYFKKIDAIEFAVKYDDGRDPRGLLSADVVLVGVSRTSKTPLSQFLAHKGLKVANVPIVPEVDPPPELFLVSPDKCFGLKITPEKLNNIRKERLLTLGLSDEASYANMVRIQEELDYFQGIVDRIGCQIIDVTNKAVEETANIIIQDEQFQNSILF